MKQFFLLAAVLLLMLGPQAYAEEQLPPCIPLNETLSICTDIDGLGVSFVGATETSAMGIVRPHSTEGIFYVWAVYWDIDLSLFEFSSEEVKPFAEQEPVYELQDPESVVIEGFPGIRYDLLPGSEGDRELLPKLLLFLDTGGGIAILNGEARRPDVSAEDVYTGAKSAARIIKRSD